MNSKPKILQLSAIDVTLYKFVVPLMKELKKEGFEVICAAKDLGYLDKIRKDGFKTYNIPMTRSLNPLAVLNSIYEVYKLLKKENVDIIHVHTPIASFVGRLAATFAGVKIKVYTAHGFRIDNKLFYIIEKIMAKYFTDYIFTVNYEDMKMAVDKGFISQNKILNLNSVGIDIEKFNPNKISEEEKIRLRKSLNINEEDNVIGYVGRIVKIKGVLDLLNSYIEVRKKIKCKLLLVGPWQNLSERKSNQIIDEVKKIIKENKIEKDVIMTGSREDIPQLLSIMDVFVLPSYWEGMPVSLMEAMAMERPVIATNIRGTREEVDDMSGILFEPKDTKALAKHLVNLLTNKEKAKQLGKNARKRVVENFNQEKIILKQLRVFKELVKLN